MLVSLVDLSFFATLKNIPIRGHRVSVDNRVPVGVGNGSAIHNEKLVSVKSVGHAEVMLVGVA